MSLNTEVRVVFVGVPGVNGTGITDAEKNQITTDLAALQARPNITALDAVPNVNDTAKVNGSALVYNTTTGNWEAGDVSGAISGVLDVASNTTFPDISTLGATNGMHAASGGTGIVYIMPTFEGTGSRDRVSRADHTHNPTINPGPQTFLASGRLTSGTRTLITYNAGPLINGITYDVTAKVVVHMRGDDSGAGVSNLGLRIGGHASFPTTTTEVRTVQGVDRLAEWEFARTDANGGAIAGTGSTVTITATVAFSSGAAMNIRHGYIIVDARPRR